MFKDFFETLVDFWHEGIIEKITILIVVSALIALISLPFFIYYDRLEMTAQHCVQTNQSRESTFIQTIYGDKGQIITMYPVTTTEYLYTCDDYPRWR